MMTMAAVTNGTGPDPRGSKVPGGKVHALMKNTKQISATNPHTNI